MLSKLLKVRVNVITGRGRTAPRKLQRLLDKKLNSKTFRPKDRAWIVCDRDEHSWSEDEIDEVARWAKNRDCYGLALSNPLFELWLLLHFEKGARATKKDDISKRLKKYDSQGKGVQESKYTLDAIRTAIKNADKKHVPKSLWPRKPGQTTVYLLVRETLEASEELHSD